jgi:hypothetical protein
MSELRPLLRDQREADADHLAMLAIFHFVGAGFACMGIGFLLVHYKFMHHFLTSPKLWEHLNQRVPPGEILEMAIKFYLLFGVWFLTSLILNVISGFCIRARRCRVFSLVVGAINCLQIPLITILGIFTIIILCRNSVREVYQTQGGPR